MMQETESIRNALEHLDKIAKRLDDRLVAVFLDYDGTLTPIVAHPEDATLSGEMLQVLKELAGIFTVTIVSGRDLRDVQDLVGLEQIYYAGSHGFEVMGPNDVHMQNARGKQVLPDLEEAEDMLENDLAEIHGCQIERKQFAIAVHYRNVDPEDVSRVGEIFGKIAEQCPRLRRRGGKRVFELQPDVDWDKGKAVLWLMKALKIEKHLPVYIGDDTTDEDAFRRLKGRGIGIRVADEDMPTSADYLVKDVPQVREFLQWLTAHFAEKE